MDRRILFPAVAATAWAQQASPAAAQAEKALQDRVQQFYQLQVDKKYRQAESFVADDTKDDYYNMRKPNIKSFTIGNIELLENNTFAKVVVKAKVVVLMPGAGAQVLEFPTPTTWKIENGEWRWYISEAAKTQSPFGKMNTSGAAEPPSRKGEAPGGIEHPDISALQKGLSVDRTQVNLTADKPVETVTITNSLPGPADLRIDPHVAMIKGLTVELSKSHLEAGEKSVVSLRLSGSAKISDVVEIVAAPLNVPVDIQVIAK